jgi:hypothetical protein
MSFGLAATHPCAQQQHVAHRMPSVIAHHQPDAGLHRLPDGGRGAGRRHVDRRSPWRRSAARASATLAWIGMPSKSCPPRCGVHAGDEGLATVGIVAAEAGVEGAGLAGHALRDDARVAVDEDAHAGLPGAAHGGNHPLGRLGEARRPG